MRIDSQWDGRAVPEPSLREAVDDEGMSCG